jgi:c-di-GMP-binding flagellar brake protein YcgR
VYALSSAKPESQRRRFHRQQSPLPLFFSVAEGEDEIDRPARAIDISASGLAMESDTGLPPSVGEWLALKVAIPDRPGMVIVAEVTRSLTPTCPGMWAVALDYQAITEDERDVIVSYVLGVETKRIRYQNARAKC